MHDATLFSDHRGTTVRHLNIEADPEHVAWLDFNLEIKHAAYRKAGGMIANPRAVGSLTNAITGLKPRRTRYDVTDPGQRRRPAAGHAERREALVFSVLLAQ